MRRIQLTADDDYHLGTDAAEVIRALGGNDFVDGAGGADLIAGGDGNDTLAGNGDQTRFYVDDAADTLDGGAGNDVLFAGATDSVDGGAGLDYALVSFRLSNVNAAVRIVVDDLLTPDGLVLEQGGVVTGVESYGFEGSVHGDRIVANALTEYVDGGEGDDLIIGGDEDDLFIGNGGADTLRGGGGDDTLDGVTNLFGGGDNVVSGGAGDDIVRATYGDTLIGGSGYDTLEYDAILGGDPTGDLSALTTREGGSLGTTQFRGFEAAVVSLSNVANDVFFGTANILQLYAYGGADRVAGNAGSSLIDGGYGSDTLDGGDGIDTVSFESTANQTGSAGVRISLARTGPQHAIGEDRDIVRNFENLTGTTLNDDRLAGDDGGNVIVGNHGDDTLLGGAGDDTLYGDTLTARLFYTNADPDSDVIDGGDGRDVIVGGARGDTLTGGAGADRFVFAVYSDTWTETGIDRITDLQSRDLIDLSQYDAVYGTPEREAFTFVTSPSTTPGTLYWTYDAASDTSTLVLRDDSSASPPIYVLVDGDQTGFDNFLL